jgi:hypothetical protein
MLRRTEILHDSFPVKQGVTHADIVGIKVLERLAGVEVGKRAGSA